MRDRCVHTVRTSGLRSQCARLEVVTITRGNSGLFPGALFRCGVARLRSDAASSAHSPRYLADLIVRAKGACMIPVCMSPSSQRGVRLPMKRRKVRRLLEDIALNQHSDKCVDL